MVTKQYLTDSDDAVYSALCSAWLKFQKPVGAGVVRTVMEALELHGGTSRFGWRTVDFVDRVARTLNRLAKQGRVLVTTEIRTYHKHPLSHGTSGKIIRRRASKEIIGTYEQPITRYEPVGYAGYGTT